MNLLAPHRLRVSRNARPVGEENALNINQGYGLNIAITRRDAAYRIDASFDVSLSTQYAAPATNTSLDTTSFTNITSLSLAPGVWMIGAQVQFSRTDANSRTLQAQLLNETDSNTVLARVGEHKTGVTGGASIGLEIQTIVTLSGTSAKTIQLQAQTSSTGETVVGGSNPPQTYLWAVRLA